MIAERGGRYAGGESPAQWPLEWRATTALAGLLEQRGDAEASRDRLRAVCGSYADGLDSLELDDAQSLLVALS